MSKPAAAASAAENPDTDAAILAMLSAHPGLLDVAGSDCDLAIDHCFALPQAPRRWIIWRLELARGAIRQHARSAGRQGRGRYRELSRRAVPDGLREKFDPKVELRPLSAQEFGFMAGNASGLNAAELVALNRALGRLMAYGLTKWETKLRLHNAVAHWLEPKDAAGADLDRLLG